ncbi:MAG TPA: ROK family protein [Bacteroidales bacterium]
MKNYAIGVDIGGSHISCAVIDLKKKTILPDSYSTELVDNKAKADDILNNWASAIKGSLNKIERNELAGIGFAMPGPFEYDKGIARFSHVVDKYENLFGINIANYLKEAFSLEDESQVRFMNDASAFAVGEAWFGKAAEVAKSVSITLGTGFGSAFIDEGLPVVEREDVPKMGCVWHLPFRNGIGDDYFSTRWFIKRYAERTGQRSTGVKEIAEKAKTDPWTKEIFIEYGQNLGLFLGPRLKTFDAEVLVIGGNVSEAFPLFGEYFKEILRNMDVKTSIHISELKEGAALIGSARMFEQDFWMEIKPLLSKM